MIICPACTHVNPDVQNFCGKCGARLPGTEGVRASSYTQPHLARDVLTSRFALEGERKLVTVMFCDIADSTPLAARVGAEAMHGLLNRFFELALAEVHRYEGTINQFLGDGFMALFGAPIAHEDHARRALLAAAAIQQLMREASGEAQALREVRLRMGLNTGMVVVGKIGDNLRMDYTAIGDTTNVAARLQSVAEPGTIRVSASTRRAAEAHFTFRDLGWHALKGIAESVAIFEPLRPRSVGDTSPQQGSGVVGSVLVGREQQLGALSRSLDNLAAGKGGIVLVEGEPGAGKSRLLAEARKFEAARGVLWLEGRSVSFGRGLSYLPFIEVLKQAFDIKETDAEAEALAKLEAGVGRLFDARAAEIVPYLATVMAIELTGDLQQRVAFLDAQAMKRQVFLSTRQLLERAAQTQSVLIVLEDWHWVDKSSIALLEHLLPLAQTHAIMFWLTTRTEPAEPAARVRMVATALPSLLREEIAVAPLAAQDSRALLDNLIGAGSLPDAVRAQIERRTEGNPFFIEEVVHALIADGTLVQDARAGGLRLTRPVAELAIPDTVQGVIVARIDRLDESVKSVLKLASVVGRSFFLRILKAIAEAADSVEQGLGTLEAAELIRLRQQVPELEYIFKHALVQEAAYGSILAERRRAIHRAVGGAIESLFPERLEEFASLLAYHYALAEDWEKAQAFLFKAGDRAGRIAADAEALEHYRQAEATFMKVAGKELTPLQRATLDRKLGQAFYGVGNYEQAVEHFTKALGHLGIRYPKSRWGVRRSVATHVATHFVRRLLPGARASTQRTLAPDIARETSAICQSLAWMDYFVDEERFGLDSLIELRAGERSGDPFARSRGLAMLGAVLITIGANRLAWARLVEAVAVARANGQPATIAPAAFFHGWLQYTRGGIDESLGGLEEAVAAYRQIGDIRGLAAASTVLCFASYFRADYDTADKRAKEMVRLAQDAGDPNATSWSLNVVGAIGLAVGPLDQAESDLRRVRDLSSQASAFRMKASVGGILGRCLLRRGRLVEATAILKESADFLDSHNMRDMLAAEPRNAFAELCLVHAGRLSGLAQKQALVVATKACKKALRCTQDVQPYMVETLRLRGTLAWLSGDHQLARKQWEKSLETGERLREPVERARVLLEMGTRLGDATLIEQARRVFEQTGARVDLAISLHALARLSAAAAADPAAALPPYDEAIALLEAVKAECHFGLACQERAQLLAKCGRRDEARADLGRARRSFEAAGADAERAEAEKAEHAFG